jgi:hypothetical protein
MRHLRVAHGRQTRRNQRSGSYENDSKAGAAPEMDGGILG